MHFSRKIADLIVHRIMDFHDSGRVIPDDFGIQLTPGNVERVIADARLAQARYEGTHREEIDALHAVLRTVQ